MVALPIQRFVAVEDVVLAGAAGGRLHVGGVWIPAAGSVRANAPSLSMRAMAGSQALLLLVRAEHADRAHRETGVDAEQGADRAVDAAQLVLDEAVADVVEGGAAVAALGPADDGEVAQAEGEGEGDFGAFPVVVDGGV